jgi:hypothetical protein
MSLVTAILRQWSLIVKNTGTERPQKNRSLDPYRLETEQRFQGQELQFWSWVSECDFGFDCWTINVMIWMRSNFCDLFICFVMCHISSSYHWFAFAKKIKQLHDVFQVAADCLSGIMPGRSSSRAWKGRYLLFKKLRFQVLRFLLINMLQQDIVWVVFVFCNAFCYWKTQE